MLHFPLAAAAQPDLMSTVQSFLPLIFLFAMLYFMILRPKQRDEKRRREMLSELKKGDKVMTGAVIDHNAVAAPANRSTAR